MKLTCMPIAGHLFSRLGVAVQRKEKKPRKGVEQVLEPLSSGHLLTSFALLYFTCLTQVNPILTDCQGRAQCGENAGFH